MLQYQFDKRVRLHVGLAGSHAIHLWRRGLITTMFMSTPSSWEDAGETKPTNDIAASANAANCKIIFRTESLSLIRKLLRKTNRAGLRRAEEGCWEGRQRKSADYEDSAAVEALRSLSFRWRRLFRQYSTVNSEKPAEWRNRARSGNSDSSPAVEPEDSRVGGKQPDSLERRPWSRCFAQTQRSQRPSSAERRPPSLNQGSASEVFDAPSRANDTSLVNT